MHNESKKALIAISSPNAVVLIEKLSNGSPELTIPDIEAAINQYIPSSANNQAQQLAATLIGLNYKPNHIQPYQPVPYIPDNNHIRYNVYWNKDHFYIHTP